MAKEPSFALLNTAAVEVRAARGQQAFAAYWALTKPEVNFLILITTFAGFYLASVREPGSFPVVRVICTLLGTLLVAGGTGALNQFLERSFDVEMRRTARRPITSGRVAPLHALLFGLALSLGGALFLAFSRQRPCFRVVGRDARELPLDLHATETKNSSVHFDRCFPRRCTSVDRVGRSARTLGPGSMDSLCSGLPLAVPALHGHCLDVSG